MLNDPESRPQDPLEALQAGDPAPFEDFVRRFAPRLLGWFERSGAHRAEAEDLTQESFLRMYQRIHTYVPQGRPEAWALRIARNAWIDRRRRDGARPWRSGDTQEMSPLVADDQQGPVEVAAEREETEALQAALATLPEGQREAFELGVLQGLVYAEVSEVLGIPVGTVKSRIFHAVRRLQGLLGGQA